MDDSAGQRFSKRGQQCKNNLSFPTIDPSLTGAEKNGYESVEKKLHSDGGGWGLDWEGTLDSMKERENWRRYGVKRRLTSGT